MNVFFLSRSSIIAAQSHADIHVGKMLLEACQLLSTAHHEHGNGDKVTYLPTHKNHPCAVWVRSSKTHYMYVAELAKNLAQEYRNRFRKTHASELILEAELMMPPPELKTMRWTDPPQCMPDEFKDADVVEAYQKYYASKASDMKMIWNGIEDNSPWWFIINRNNYLASKGLYVKQIQTQESIY